MQTSNSLESPTDTDAVMAAAIDRISRLAAQGEDGGTARGGPPARRVIRPGRLRARRAGLVPRRRPGRQRSGGAGAEVSFWPAATPPAGTWPTR